MRPLDLNLASRPFRNDVLLAAFYVVVGVALLAWAVVAPLRYSGLVERKGLLRAELQEMRTGTQSFDEESREFEAKIKTLPLEEMRERSSFAREVLEHRNFSWTTLFNHLEEPGVVPCDVRLMSLRPRYVENVMFIDVRGVSRKGLEGYFEFLDSLLNNPHFYTVNPRGFRESPQDSGYIFNLSFSYFPNPDSALPAELLLELELAKEELDDAEDAAAREAAGEADEEGAGGDGSEEEGADPQLEPAEMAEEGLGAQTTPDEAAASGAGPAAPGSPARATTRSDPPAAKEEPKDRPRRRRRPVQRDPAIPRPNQEPGQPEKDGSDSGPGESGEGP